MPGEEDVEKEEEAEEEEVGNVQHFSASNRYRTSGSDHRRFVGNVVAG